MPNAMPPNARREPPHETGAPATAALIATGVLGGGIVLAMPVVATAIGLAQHVDDHAVGQFAAVQLLFIALGCFAALWVHRWLPLRTVAVGAATGLLLADVASALAPGFASFLAIRAAAGLAGGLAISTTTAALARRHRPDRLFGLFLLAQLAFGMVCSGALPWLVTATRPGSMFEAFAVLDAMVLLAAWRLLPAVALPGAGRQRGMPCSRRQRLVRAAMLAAILVFFVGIGAFWTYAGRLGVAAGLDATSVGRGLGLAGLAGIAGAFLPVWLQTRLGRVLPCVVGSAAMLFGAAGLHALAEGPDAARYTLSTAAFMFGWYLVYPYQLGLLSLVDRDGRGSVLAAAVTGIGLGIGPAIAAPFAATDLRAAYVFAAAALVVATVLLLAAARGVAGHDRTAPWSRGEVASFPDSF